MRCGAGWGGWLHDPIAAKQNGGPEDQKRADVHGEKGGKTKWEPREILVWNS